MKRTIKGLTAPNRIFGRGESREQNAIIKVYSVQELKNALTKIYSFKGGIGTIQIAGDITISEPIQLKQFIEGEAAPKEIIIQSIAGARILNGNKTAGDWDYDMPGNTEIPVFDIGQGRQAFGLPRIPQPVVKYTFLDLVINSDTSRPFGAFLVANLFDNWPTFLRFLPEVKINNLKLFNVHNLFACYYRPDPFPVDVIISLVTPNINGVSVRNTDPSIGSFYLNTPAFGFFNGVFSNFGALNWDDKYLTTNHLKIYTNDGFYNNTFNGIGLLTEILDDPAISIGNSLRNNGQGNTLIGGELISFPKNNWSFSFINCGIPNLNGQGFGAQNFSVFPTGYGPRTGVDLGLESRNSFNIVTPNFTPNSAVENFTVESTFCQYTEERNATVSLQSSFVSIPENSEYEVNWHFTVRKRSTNQVNTYHIKTNVRRETGNITIISNNTIAASEEFLGLGSIFPVSFGSGMYIRPYLSATEELDVSCVVKMTGRGLPTL